MAPPPSGPYLETRRRHAVGDKEAFDRGRRDDRDQRVRRQRQSAGIARLYADMHVDRPVGAGAPVKVQHKSDELVAQLFAQRPLAGVLFEELVVRAGVPHPY